ncbi:MAG TPA: aminotransferase class IV [Planctomycetota bacterium]|nr:aminotransferase class IV [Planctomycetota bacterium]
MQHPGSAPEELAYVRGRVLPAAEAVVPFHDRGFFFAEAAYEAYVGRGGRIFAFDAHQARLRRTLEGIRIPEVDRAVAEVGDAVQALLERFGRGAFLLYVQVTGGVAPRRHVLAVDPPPAVYAFIRAHDLDALEREQARGLKVLSRPDVRWKFATYKTTQLLPNVLAKKAARDAGCDEILFVAEDGAVLEGGSTNVFWVEKGRVFTPPLDRNLLPGVTRRTLLERGGLETTAAAAPLSRVRAADEIFLTGTSLDAASVTHVDGAPVGDGRPGPTARRAARILRDLFDAECPA